MKLESFDVIADKWRCVRLEGREKRVAGYGRRSIRCFDKMFIRYYTTDATTHATQRIRRERREIYCRMICCVPTGHEIDGMVSENCSLKERRLFGLP